MSFVSINTDDQDSELSKKSLEQQRLELEKFEEIKECYHCAVNYVKQDEIAHATNVLLNLFDNELFNFKSFDAKQLQKAVMKLLLSLNTATPERQLSICLRGLEMFSDEKCFWERCGELLVEGERYEEAIQVYDYLFKSDPFSQMYLQNYIKSLKLSFKFDELDNLKSKLQESGWIDQGQGLLASFDWRNDFHKLAEDNASNFHKDGPKALETLSIPFRDVNWMNYASILHSMVTGNYLKIFKKQPFNPDNYSILNGPCLIEIIGNFSTNTQSQSVLLNSLHDYSASSMDDLSKKRSSRRKEPKTNQTINFKTELTPADLVKSIKIALNLEDQEIVDVLCNTERSCLQLLDKNNVFVSQDSLDNETSHADTFTIESLNQRISSDNETRKSLFQRIFELISFFFIHSRQSSSTFTTATANFPSSLPKPIIDLWQLFRIGTFSLETLKESLNRQYLQLILGVCEVKFSLKMDFSFEFAILKSAKMFSNDSFLEIGTQFDLLEALCLSEEDQKYKKLEEIAESLGEFSNLCTRYSGILTETVSSKSLKQAIQIMKQEEIISKAETLQDNVEEVLKLFDAEKMSEMISNSCGEMKLRLIKLSFLLFPDIRIPEAISELLLFYSHLELDKFITYLPIFLSKQQEQLTSPEKCILLCTFWNIYAKRHLIPNNLINSLNDCFANLVSNVLIRDLDLCRFLLSWLSQEKSFGSAHGIVPLKIFSLFAASSDFTEMKFAYSVAFSLFRFPTIFTESFEEWDRSPIGLGSRDCPCPNLNETDLDLLSNLIQRLDETIDLVQDSNCKFVISEPGFVSFVDWLKKQFVDLSQKLEGKHFFYCLKLNKNHISAYLNASLDLHTKKQVLIPPRGHFSLQSAGESFKCLLNTRSDIVYSELQGRKKSFEILKTIRSDLKLSLALDVYDAQVWKLLGICYHDAAIHFMSSEAEIITSNSAKLKRCMKKAILSLKLSIKLNQNDRESWSKLLDLIDWSLHEPSLLFHDLESLKYLCSIGCSCVQFLLPGSAPRDRWILFLRLELFLRKSQEIDNEYSKQLELLKEASLAASSAYSENVYESTALYMSLVKLYSRLSKFRIAGHLNEESVLMWLNYLNGKLPVCLQTTTTASSGDQLLFDHLEALNVLDRKKIFHSHSTALANHALNLLNDSQAAFTQYQQLFPFLKVQKKTNTASLLQIYQNDHERPARFLIAGKRYLLQLLSFIDRVPVETLQGFVDKSDLLTQFLKKLHYIRRTIIGFPEILSKATLIYLNCDRVDQEIVKELVGSLKLAFNTKIPEEIKVKLESLQ